MNLRTTVGARPWGKALCVGLLCRCVQRGPIPQWRSVARITRVDVTVPSCGAVCSQVALLALPAYQLHVIRPGYPARVSVVGRQRHRKGNSPALSNAAFRIRLCVLAGTQDLLLTVNYFIAVNSSGTRIRSHGDAGRQHAARDQQYSRSYTRARPQFRQPVDPDQARLESQPASGSRDRRHLSLDRTAGATQPIGQRLI